MKTIFRFLSLAVVAAAGAVAGFAQTPTPDPVCADVDAQNALYTPFTETYNKKTVADIDKAIELGKSFLEKFGNCESVKEQVAFVKGWVPKLEKRKGDVVTGAKYKRFDDAVTAKNWDEAYIAGREITASNQNEANIMVALGLIGLDQTYQKNYKFSDQAIQNAESAIKLLKSGTPPKAKENGNLGAFAYECKFADCQGDLTFAIGHIRFWGKSDKTGALPYYYEATQLPGRNKENPAIYEAIGTFYVEKAAPIRTEIAAAIDKQSKATTDEIKLQIENTEIKPKVALLNGYSERIIDAFGRAHKFTKDTTRKGVLYKELQRLYELRFDKKEGLDTYIASTVAKPLPNPTSNVEPIVDPEPAKTDSTTGTSTTTPAPAAKPATTTPTKPLSTTGAKVSAATTSSAAPAAETVAKKPVAKKKGTH